MTIAAVDTPLDDVGERGTERGMMGSQSNRVSDDGQADGASECLSVVVCRRVRACVGVPTVARGAADGLR